MNSFLTRSVNAWDSRIFSTYLPSHTRGKQLESSYSPVIPSTIFNRGVGHIHRHKFEQAHSAGEILCGTVNDTGIPFQGALGRLKVKFFRDLFRQVWFEAGRRLSLQGKFVQRQVGRNSLYNLDFNMHTTW